MDASNTNRSEVVLHVSPQNNVGVPRLVYQQPMPVLYNTGRLLNCRYLKLKVIPIQIFASACIIIGLTSIVIQIAALVLNETLKLYDFDLLFADYVGAGIWGGILYVIAGSLGVEASYKRTQSLLVGTVVMSALSIAASITAATLAGAAAGYGPYCWYYLHCDYSATNAWVALEWTLMALSILQFCMVIPLLVLASVPLCCSSKPEGNINMNTTGFQQQAFVVAANGQPVYYYQPQQLIEQPPPVYQAYVSQQTQQQQSAPLPQLIPIKQ